MDKNPVLKKKKSVLSVSSTNSVEKHVQSLHRLSNTYLRGRIHSCRSEKKIEKQDIEKIVHDIHGPRGLPTRVLWIKYEILNILGIDTVGQSFRTRCILEATWEEPALNSIVHSNNTTVDILNMSEVWKPRRVKFMNEIEEGIEPNIEICDWDPRPGKDDAVVTCYFNYTGSFLTKMNLKMFPFDFQELTLDFTMLTRQLDLIFELNPLRGSEFNQQNSQMHEWILSHTTEKFEVQKENKYLPVFHITLHCKRRAGYYLINVMIPVLLITSLTWLGYSIPSHDLGSRLEAVLTLVLTSVAFKFVVAGHLPRLSYSTLCDHYMILSLLFQTAIATEIGLTAVLVEDDDFKQTLIDKIDRIFMLVTIGAYTCMHVIFGFVVMRHVTNMSVLWTQQQMNIRSSSRIDDCTQLPDTLEPAQQKKSSSRVRNAMSTKPK